MGAMGLLLLYFIVLMRLIQNAQTAPDRAGRSWSWVWWRCLLPHPGQCGHGGWIYAGHRNSFAINELWRVFSLFMFLALGIVMNVRMRRFVN